MPFAHTNLPSLMHQNTANVRPFSWHQLDRNLYWSWPHRFRLTSNILLEIMSLKLNNFSSSTLPSSVHMQLSFLYFVSNSVITTKCLSDQPQRTLYLQCILCGSSFPVFLKPWFYSRSVAKMSEVCQVYAVWHAYNGRICNISFVEFFIGRLVKIDYNILFHYFNCCLLLGVCFSDVSVMLLFNHHKYNLENQVHLLEVSQT